MLHTLRYTSRPREAERYVGGGTLSVSQTASRSSIKPAQPARAEPKLHASIIININIASKPRCWRAQLTELERKARE